MGVSSDQRVQLGRDTRQLLEQLGSNADEVAANLQHTGVRGVPGDSRNCAIARYLNAVMTADSRVLQVRVTPRIVRIRNGRWWWSPRVAVTSPEAIRSFIVRFDHGHFARLCVRPTRAATKDDRAPVRATGV